MMANVETLIAVPELALRNGTEHIGLLDCGHQIMIDGDFIIDDQGRISWVDCGVAPSSIIFACPHCPPRPNRVRRTWRVCSD